MEHSCSQLHITKDFVSKLEVFKILLLKYEEEIYQDIDNEISKKYLKIKLEKEQKDNNGSNRN